MKPLPFDMTPLAQSLSLVRGPRLTTGEPPVRGSTALSTREAPAESAPVKPAPIRSGIDSSPPEAVASRDAGNHDGSTGPTPAEPMSRKEKRAEKKSSKARDASTRNVPAQRPRSAPTTELRTGIYPTHVCDTKGWAGQLAAEQIHALATHVLARHTQQNLRSLAITSALAGEGKTTVTLALARKLAGAGKRVLILDLDTHRATLSREAGLEDAAGALQSSDPRDIADMSFHAYATDVPGLSIMPAGYQPSGVMGPPLLSPVHTSVLVLNALEKYDFVLLDCPPLLPVAETFVLREIVDSAIMVVKASSTPREMIDQAIDDFGRDKFMAAILNRTKPGDIPYFREVYGYYRRDSSRS